MCLFLQTDSSTMMLLIESMDVILHCILCLNTQHLKPLEAIVGWGGVQIRGQYNKWYGQVLTFVSFNLCVTPSLFHNIFLRFKHPLLNALRHATWINGVKPQTHSTPEAAVLLALFHTVINLKNNPLTPLLVP